MGTRVVMDRAEQLMHFSKTISFYEKSIEESICKKDFDTAKGWYREMKGACFLAERIGLMSNTLEQDRRNDEWFQRILDAQYGKAAGDLG